MPNDLELAHALADAADAITLPHFRSPALRVRTKHDQTPVSEADEAAERALRAMLAAHRPSDAVVGEEYGVEGSASRQWYIDPIDATKNYVRGIPIFATLVAVTESGHPLAAVISAPALGRRWWASRAGGSFCNGSAIRVSSVNRIERSHLAYDSVTDFDRFGTADAFLRLVRRCERSRGFGDFWAHMLVAEGSIEIAVEPAVSAWDVAAVQLIVEEAGGRFTSLGGEARFDGGSALSTNGLLHDAVLEELQ
jgi:histidinol-phosphatase